MPASLPGATVAENLANPTDAPFVIFDPLSGPKGSPLDAMEIDYTTGTPAGWNASTRIPIKVANDEASGLSTGGLSTGIGIGSGVIGQTPDADRNTAPKAILAEGFDDNLIPGEEPTYAAPPPVGVVSSNAIDSTRMYIGGGRTVTSGAPHYNNVAGVAGTNPYTAGIAICGAGQGSGRDGGAGPAYTGFPLKMATATGTVANGAAIESGVANRTGASMLSGQSAFGVAASQLAAAS